MNEIALVRTTFADEDTAMAIGQTLVEEGLAACVNVAPDVRSTFRWDGRIDTAIETVATFKTTTALAHRLAERIAERHDYDLPVVESWTVTVSVAVAAWVAQSTGHTPTVV